MDETLADNGGLHLAYATYRRSELLAKQLTGTPVPMSNLPGFESYSDDQLFFSRLCSESM